MQKAIKNALIVSGLVAGAGYLWRLKRLGDRLQYDVINVSRNRSTNLQTSSITVEMRLTNPTNATLDVNSLQGFIYYGSQIIARMNSKKRFTIAPGVSNLSLNFIVDNMALLNSAARAALNRQAKTIRVEYQLNTNFGRIPQSFSLNAGSIA